MAITLALLVPTVIFVNLRLPRWRAVLDAVSLLPLGVPAVVIVLGVLGAYRNLPDIITGTPLILALVYVILAMPYSYRAIDAGVRSIDLHTLVDAGRSMGAGWGKLFSRVLLPNLRSGILAAAFLTVALSLGEYAIASIMGFTTFPVWLVSVEGNNPYVAVALSIAALACHLDAPRGPGARRLGEAAAQRRLWRRARRPGDEAGDLGRPSPR